MGDSTVGQLSQMMRLLSGEEPDQEFLERMKVAADMFFGSEGDSPLPRAEGLIFSGQTGELSALRTSINALEERYRKPFLLLLRIVEVQIMAETYKGGALDRDSWKREMIKEVMRNTKDAKARLRLELVAKTIDMAKTINAANGRL